MSLRASRPLRTRGRVPNVVNWLAAAAVAALLGVGAGTLLRADEAPNPIRGVDALIRALGAPTGVLALVNPLNCALTAEDAAALNSIARVPGVRVTVLLVAVPAHDSVIRNVRRDFDFSAHVVVRSASSVDPRALPALFRMPFIGVVVRGQLRHAAWGESLKSLSSWLPVVVGTS